MINKKFLSLPISFSVNNETHNDDTRFINVTIDVLHTGKNFNDSIFNKDVVDECIDSIKNTAILGFIRELPNGEKDFKGHEYVLTKTDGQGVVRKYIGSAYGLIPESCNPRWTTKICDDGVEREFLQVDGLLWTKFEDSSTIMSSDIVKPQSMELEPTSIDGYEDENGDFVFTHFSFDGCCILGDSIEPAMINSTVEVKFSMSDFVRNVQKELNDKYSAFTKLVDADINKGGNETMSQDNKDFALSMMQQFENIAAIVSQQEMYRDRWGDERCRYSLVDIQGEEVIVTDRMNNYNYYGFPYTINGDAPTIDFACGTRKKISYENYDDGASVPEGAFVFGKEIQEIEEKAFSRIEDANQKVSDAEGKIAEAEENYTNMKSEYEAVKNEYEEIKPKYDEYVKAEQIRIENELNAEKDAEFEKFEYALSENEEFASLKEKKDEMSIEEIKTQCAILYTKVNLESNKVNFSKSNSNLSIDIMDDCSDDGDCYVTTKYGNIPVRR